MGLFPKCVVCLVCADGSLPNYCSNTLCSSFPCLESRGIRCRINPCGGCKAELYDRQNQPVNITTLIEGKNSQHTFLERDLAKYYRI